jgi:adenine-specific DNA-methyltransferase
MPTIQFEGKPFVQDHHLTVERRALLPDQARSLTDRVDVHDNLIIHGDSLKTIKALLPTYEGRVKCIHMDSPDNAGWRYNDDVDCPMIQGWRGGIVRSDDPLRHDKWLCMMTPRLKLCRELLDERGLILVSVGENELANLLYLCDEIYGEDNRLEVFVVQESSPLRSRVGVALAGRHKYLVSYTKDRSRFEPGRLDLTEERLQDFPEIDHEGKHYRFQLLRSRHSGEDRPGRRFPLFVDPHDRTVHLEEVAGRLQVLPAFPDGRPDWWVWDIDKIRQENNRLVAKLNPEGRWQIGFKDYAQGRPIPSVWQGMEFEFDTGEREVEQSLGRRLTNIERTGNPPPMALFRRILALVGDQNAIFLDNSMGLGAAGVAVLNANQSDGGNRKFILIEPSEERVRLIETRIGAVIQHGQYGSFSYYELGNPIP